jgi:hemerythrin-like domain-containing protein
MPVKLGAAVDHGFDEPLGLLSDCHRRIENFLGVLEKVVGLAQGALNEEQRRAAETALTYFRTAAPRHTQDEEQSLFPRLRASGEPRACAALETIQSLEADHGVADAGHAEIETLFGHWIEQGGLSDERRRRLAELLAELRELYRRHIEVEDRELFPLAGQVLSKEEIAAVGREMAERRGLGAP